MREYRGLKARLIILPLVIGALAFGLIWLWNVWLGSQEGPGITIVTPNGTVIQGDPEVMLAGLNAVRDGRIGDIRVNGDSFFEETVLGSNRPTTQTANVSLPGVSGTLQVRYQKTAGDNNSGTVEVTPIR